MDSFTKKTTNVGGTIGVIIPKEVAYKEGIKKGTTIRVIIEAVSDGLYWLLSHNLQESAILPERSAEAVSDGFVGVSQDV